MSNVVEVNEQNFEKLIASEKPVLIDFYANWCGPCNMMKPVIAKVAEDLADNAIVAKFDVDATNDIAPKYGIRNIPAFLVFKNGEVVNRAIGVQTPEQLKALLS